MVTPLLFKEFPTPHDMGKANIEDIKECIKSINFFNNKAVNIKKTAFTIDTVYNGQVPDDRDLLMELPGVGRKTANVVIGQAFDQPGITVDTHVKRLSQRLKFTNQSDPLKVEFDLIKVWDESLWTEFSSILILHGRNTCKARKALCSSCEVAKFCPSNSEAN